MKTTKSLHDQVEFDCPFRVNEDRSITTGWKELQGIYAPEVLDGEVIGPWELLNGYSMQDRYAGPIMHNSEYLGGQMEKDVLATPGVYVLVAAMYSPDGDDEEGEGEYTYEGWALARLIED